MVKIQIEELATSEELVLCLVSRVPNVGEYIYNDATCYVVTSVSHKMTPDSSEPVAIVGVIQ